MVLITARRTPDNQQCLAWVMDLTTACQETASLQRQSEELRAANAQLTSFNQLMVGRELRMVELKREVDNLCRQFHQKPPYALDAKPPGSATPE